MRLNTTLKDACLSIYVYHISNYKDFIESVVSPSIIVWWIRQSKRLSDNKGTTYSNKTSQLMRRNLGMENDSYSPQIFLNTPLQTTAHGSRRFALELILAIEYIQVATVPHCVAIKCYQLNKQHLWPLAFQKSGDVTSLLPGDICLSAYIQNIYLSDIYL